MRACVRRKRHAVCVSMHAQALPRPTMSTCVLESASRPCLPRSSSARWGETLESQCPSNLLYKVTINWTSQNICLKPRLGVLHPPGQRRRGVAAAASGRGGLGLGHEFLPRQFVRVFVALRACARRRRSSHPLRKLCAGAWAPVPGWPSACMVVHTRGHGGQRYQAR